MNRFRTRKKSLGEASREGSRPNSRRPSLDNDVPVLPSFAKTFKRKKTPAPEPKPEVDLTSALPHSDDFRTSLLMPKLCARFSMLKEQDDPKSMLGKANDDSVLFPKRASRLDLFNSRPGLSDLVEVDSTRGSLRPPFDPPRTESYGSEGHGADEGSIMGRSKPGEGNTMFGGRQKIYKIPVGGAGSVKNFGGQDEEGTNGGTMAGKPVYESDTALSTFQQLRQREKEEREKASYESAPMVSSREQDRSGSPPFPRYNRNRETSSSTTSAPSQSRASTAATSVASQKSIYVTHDTVNGISTNTTQLPPANSDRMFIKSRRLYGQNLDRETLEIQPSLQRIGSFNRARTPAGLAANPLRQSRSATNLGDRFQRGGPLHTPNTFPAESPAPSPTRARIGEFDLGLSGDHATNHMVDFGCGRSPPLSPPKSPDLDSHHPDPTLVSSLQPNDIGKATASGAFNKPKRQYDEQQYLQRQLQMQEERNTPSPQFSRSFSPPLSSLNDRPSAGRSRNNSQGSALSQTNSIRRPWIEDRVPRAMPEGGRSATQRQHHEEHVRPSIERTFFSNNSVDSGSMSPAPESEPGSNAPDATGLDMGDPVNKALAQVHTPDNAASLVDPYDDSVSESRSYRSEKTVTQAQDCQGHSGPWPIVTHADSPTLGPVGVSNDLSGLVRTHLRSDSGQSSIYPDDAQQRSRKVEVCESIFGHGSALNSQVQAEDATPIRHQDCHSPPPLSLAARKILEQAKSLKNAESGKVKQVLGEDKAQRIMGAGATRSSEERSPAIYEPTRSFHTRGASTETRQEREELAQELAERRRIVQDKLQTFVEAESRSVSPAPSARTRDDNPAKASTAFGLLKKSSRASLVYKEKNSKAIKMLGIEDETAGNPPPALFMVREQLPDRAVPPGSKKSAPPSQRNGILPEMSDALGLNQSYGKMHRTEKSRFKQHSRHSSKSSSAYSGNSEGPLRSEAANGTKSGHRDQSESLNGGLDSTRSRSACDGPSLVHPTGSESSRPSVNTTERLHSAASNRLRSNSRPSPVSPSAKRTTPAGTPYMINPLTRPGPPNPSRSAPTLHDNQPLNSTNQQPLTSPCYSPTRHVTRYVQHRKQSVNKQDISEPTFISCTSSVDTVDLPPGASLKNGMDRPPSPTNPPPIPARDSRRKRTMTLRQAFGRCEKVGQSPSLSPPSPGIPHHDGPYEERSTFSDDEDAQKPKQRLRMFNKDDGNAGIRARHPGTNPRSPTSTVHGHIPFQARHDVPASAVMF